MTKKKALSRRFCPPRFFDARCRPKSTTGEVYLNTSKVPLSRLISSEENFRSTHLTSVSLMITVLLADDHDLMRQGIKTLLESHRNFEICGEARNGVEAVDKAIDLRPDVVVLDVSMPEMNGLEAARHIRDRAPDTKILVFTVYDSTDMVRDMIDAGAHGYVLKSDAYSHLAAAVEAVAQEDLYFQLFTTVDDQSSS
jgi:CheY-like chemotaxis protein